MIKTDTLQSLEGEGYVQEVLKAREIMEEVNRLTEISLDTRSQAGFMLDIVKSLIDREPIELVITACPDYSYDPATRKFTLRTLNNEVGLVTQIATDALIPMLDILDNHVIYTKLLYAQSDIEKENQYIRKVMDVSIAQFEEAIEQSSVATFLYARNLVRERKLNFVSTDSIMMSQSIVTKELVEANRPLLNEANPDDIDKLVSRRKDTLLRMYKNVIPTGMDEDAFVRERVLQDVLEHITIGNTINDERSNGKRRTLVTLSVSELTNFFNFLRVSARTPFIRVEKTY